ncbi:MAG: hypothetical protein NTY50_12995 [Methylobacter sp.]|nr:hypothetical protein [Methylobacter sp.]
MKHMTQRCFIIMPFSGKKNNPRNAKYWNSFYDDFLKQTLEELGYQCERSTASSRSIVGTIVSDLFRSDIVIAILTDFNPNVFYELGVRHSLAHGTIMAIEKNQKIPFDLAHFGVIHYDRQDRQGFKEHLVRVLKDVHMRSTPDNPVAEFLNANDISVIRISADIKYSPLDTNNVLGLAEQDLMIVGQNLFGLANDYTKDKIFAALSRKPRLRVKILYADSRVGSQTEALSQIIDEAMGEQFPKIDAAFQTWISEWRKSFPNEADRLEIRRCKRVGNVSATLVDADKPTGIILIRPILYHTNSNSRPCHWLRRNDSPRVFDSYKNALAQIWDHGDALAG